MSACVPQNDRVPTVTSKQLSLLSDSDISQLPISLYILSWYTLSHDLTLNIHTTSAHTWIKYISLTHSLNQMPRRTIASNTSNANWLMSSALYSRASQWDLYYRSPTQQTLATSHDLWRQPGSSKRSQFQSKHNSSCRHTRGCTFEYHYNSL